jgi:hypothetical protein
MSDRERTSLPTDRYWADESDPKLLCGYLRDKIGDYQDRMQASSLFARILRGWRYYHGYYFSAQGGRQAITTMGDQGELAGLAINEIRSQAQQILSIVTGNRPAFDAKAVNSDGASLSQAKLANQTLDYYFEKENMERFLVMAYEHALIFLQGFVYTVWEASKGKAVRPDETGFMMREGDPGIYNPTIFDIAYDTRVRDWLTDVRWECVRTKHLRWDLAARFPEVADELIRYSEDEFSELEWCPIKVSDGDHGDSNDPDLVSVWTFHHLGCDAMPDGRMFRFVGDIPLPGEDQADPYGWNPLSRVTAGEFLMTPHGYSPLLDLQGIVEAMNGEASSILSTHRAHGRPIICTQTGTNLSPTQLEGYTLVETDGPFPQAIVLGQVPPDQFQMKRDLRQDGEYVTGVNSVSRGQPQSKEASGSALALIDAKAAQANSPGIRNYTSLIGEVGTKLLRLLNTFLAQDEEREIAITGKHNRNLSIKLKRGAFSRIDRVQVAAGNALTRSLSGRLQLLDYISRFPSADGTPMLKTPDEIMNLVLNGSFEPMTESEIAELTVIRDENESMLDLRPVTAMFSDNHALHIREHKAQLSTTEARMDEQLAPLIGAHIMEHVQQLLLGGIPIFYIQQLLGYNPPVPPTLGMQAGMPGMPGMPGEQPEVGVVPQGGTPPGANPPAVAGPNPDMSPVAMPNEPKAMGGQPAEAA